MFIDTPFLALSVALLTERIKYMTTHLLEHKKVSRCQQSARSSIPPLKVYPATELSKSWDIVLLRTLSCIFTPTWSDVGVVTFDWGEVLLLFPLSL